MCIITRLISHMTVELFLCLVLLSINRVECNSEEVIVEQGKLLGDTSVSRNGTEYYGFLSIPFAKAPIGELRFEPPQPPVSWQGVRNATGVPPVCTQKVPFEGDNFHKIMIVGQEDCLYLNVYTPKKKNHPLPVMVFIHGGSFLFGSSNLYDPSYFMDHPIVIVTIHYRLNLFGFLSTGDHILPGNNGMKDQVMALKWIQKNIAAFGGDPNKVTIFGQSAGAGSVHYHMHSPLSKGLFHRAISQSGTALSPWAHISRELAHQKALAVGIVMGCPTKHSEILVKCLKKIPAEEFVIAVEKLFVFETEPAVPFPIVVEPDNLEGAFITENSWYHEAVNEVPWIVGITSADGAIQAIRYLQNDGSMVKILNNDYQRILPITLFYKFWIENEDKITNITESLKNFYFGNKNISSETPFELVQLFTDAYFTYGAIEAAKRHNNTVYFYYYDHRNERTFNEVFGKYPIDLGVTHSDELISLFYLNGLFHKVTKGNDFNVSERMVKYWVNFATTGDPNNKERIIWTPVQSDDLEYLHIATEADVMKKKLLKERYLFWKSLQVVPTFKPRSTPEFNDEL